VNECLEEWISSSGVDIFSVLFYMSITDFKVRNIILTAENHILDVKKNIPKILEKVFFN
jgi:hypothetical protein